MCNGEQRLSFNGTGDRAEEVNIAECIGGFGVFIAVPVEALMPLAVFLCIEEEEIVVATVNVEGEHDEDRIGKSFGSFDVDREVCPVDAILPIRIFFTLGLCGVEKRSES